MNIDKDNAMLIDIQYIRPNKNNRYNDYLYIIWKNIITGEKHLETIENPDMTIYFTKEKCRTYKHNTNYQPMKNVTPVKTPCKKVLDTIADEIGDNAKSFLSSARQMRDFKKANQLHAYPYVFASDYDPRVWYRLQWLKTLDNKHIKKLSKGFMDIEVDTSKVIGFPNARDCPIDLITLIDNDAKTSHTFILTNGIEDNPDIVKLMDDQTEFKEYCHSLFDEVYGDINYKLYFYDDERKMLVHFFQLVNKLKLDVIGIWNIVFDMPYILDRLGVLGLDPVDVICHPDFKVKECYFQHDNFHFNIKNKTDFFHCTSYTTFYCQMKLYAAVRKGQQELRSYSLGKIGKKELKDDKHDYSEQGNLSTFKKNDPINYIVYNIKDVLLMLGIEAKTSDFDTLYTASYKNATPWEDVFQLTRKLRNVQYQSYMKQNLVPGNNINKLFGYNDIEPDEEDEEEDDAYEEIVKDDKKKSKSKKVNYEGALVADPKLNLHIGELIYGKRSNTLFKYVIDMDMSAFYPNCIIGCNIDSSTLIFKLIVDTNQFIHKKMGYHSIWDLQPNQDCAKDIIDNYQTKNFLSVGSKWFNLPTMDEVYEEMRKSI